MHVSIGWIQKINANDSDALIQAIENIGAETLFFDESVQTLVDNICQHDNIALLSAFKRAFCSQAEIGAKPQNDFTQAVFHASVQCGANKIFDHYLKHFHVPHPFKVDDSIHKAPMDLALENKQPWLIVICLKYNYLPTQIIRLNNKIFQSLLKYKTLSINIS